MIKKRKTYRDSPALNKQNIILQFTNIFNLVNFDWILNIKLDDYISMVNPYFAIRLNFSDNSFKKCELFHCSSLKTRPLCFSILLKTIFYFFSNSFLVLSIQGDSSSPSALLFSNCFTFFDIVNFCIFYFSQPYILTSCSV